jgi:hypothetical protein
MKAYTIGRTSSYDQALAEATPEKPIKKTGNHEVSAEWPDGYEGGWVWKTIEQANIFRCIDLQKYEPTWKSEDFSIYELEISDWDQDTYAHSSGYNCLLNDTQILRKVSCD